MTANIWNTYEMVGAAVTGVLTGGVPAIAFMILKQRDGSRELAAANTAWSNALKVQDANDRARWAPAYSGNLFAIEAEKPHDAEVLHVEYPTAELRTLAADPQVADGLARLADEVGLVQALSDRPADDEDEVGDEQPGEATSTAVPRLLDRLWSWLSDVLAEVADRFKTDAARAREWEQVEGGPWSWDDEQRAQGVAMADEDRAGREYEGRRRREEQSVNDTYRSRHTHRDYQTGIFPAINASIPAPREAAE